jgi:hypothetical protein
MSAQARALVHTARPSAWAWIEHGSTPCKGCGSTRLSQERGTQRPTPEKCARRHCALLRGRACTHRARRAPPTEGWSMYRTQCGRAGPPPDGLTGQRCDEACGHSVGGRVTWHEPSPGASAEKGFVVRTESVPGFGADAVRGRQPKGAATLEVKNHVPRPAAHTPVPDLGSRRDIRDLRPWYRPPGKVDPRQFRRHSEPLKWLVYGG